MRIIQNKIQFRAQCYAAIRAYFSRNHVTEVHTPLLSHYGVTDIHLRAFQIKSDFHADYWLHTSPEIAMKKCLAANSGSIYQITPVFRDGGEFGRYHRPEFTMLEWYRLDFDLDQLQQDILALILFVARNLNLTLNFTAENIEKISYAQAFQKYTQINIWDCDILVLKNFCANHGLNIIDNNLNQEAYLDLIMGAYIAPQLGHKNPVFLTEYPANQAALAKLNPNDSKTAQRCELYWHGIELANAYDELNDPIEQQQRFEQEQAERARHHLPKIDYDNDFILALNHLPECSGVALGLDRLLMIFDGLLHHHCDFDIKNILLF